MAEEEGEQKPIERSLGPAWERSVEKGSSAVVPIALGGAMVLGLAGYLVDMPGSFAATIVAGILLASASTYLFFHRRGREALRWIAAGAGAALIMYRRFASTITASSAVTLDDAGTTRRRSRPT